MRLATALLAPALLALALWPEPPAAQPLPRGVVFDDLAYASTEWRETLLADGPGGAFRPDADGPPGSLYGPNRWATADGETTARAWYRYGWQESTVADFDGTLAPAPWGLRFTIPPGTYRADGCPNPAAPERTLNPQQIVTGFAARRGTWAARVRLGALPPKDSAAVIQAFWLVGPYGARVATGGGVQKAWNEIDHEFNNAFLGRAQAFDYDATGYRTGTEARPWLMYAPALGGAPAGDRRLDGQALTCTVVSADGRGRREAPAACAELLTGAADGAAPWVTLVMRVADAGVAFSLDAELADGARLAMASDVSSPPSALPLSMLLSQHFFPPTAPWTCDDTGVLADPMTLDADWVYYAADPAAPTARIARDVAALRARGVPRASTVRGLRLERPARPLAGTAAEYGFGSRTTPLSVAVVAPPGAAPGDTVRVEARLPERGGTYRFAWSATTYWPGRTRAARLGDTPFARAIPFPADADSVRVHVRVEEIDDGGRTLRNAVVQPATGWTVLRRPAGSE